MKEQNFYILKCTAKKECVYPRITIHPGEVFYFNPKAAATEMCGVYNINPYRVICDGCALPWTRNPKHAKKWQKEEFALKIKRIIESKEEFDVEVITLKVQYEVTYA